MIEPRLFAEPECWKFRDEHPDIWDTFGCGPGRIGDYFVPDNLLGLNIKIACQIHDYETRFSSEASEEHRLKIARIFKYNMIRIVWYSPNQWFFMKRLRLKMAEFYYGRVVKWGWKAYWDERNTKAQYRAITIGGQA